MCAMLGSVKSSVYFAWPVKSRGSSLRLTADPKTLDAIAASLRLHPGRGVLHRGDDVLVAGAAAEIPLEPVPDLRVGRLRVRREEVARRQDHARRAEAALEAVLLAERLLHGVELPVRREALDRRDLRAVGLDREHRAGLDGLAVEEHGARSALARVAADVGPGQAQRLPEVVDEEQPRLDLVAAAGAVDGDRHRKTHAGPPVGRGGDPTTRDHASASISFRTESKNAAVSFFVTPPMRRAARLAIVPTIVTSAVHARSVAPS